MPWLSWYFSQSRYQPTSLLDPPHLSKLFTQLSLFHTNNLFLYSFRHVFYSTFTNSNYFIHDHCNYFPNSWLLPHKLHILWRCFPQPLEFNNNMLYVKSIAKMTHTFTLISEFNKTIQESDLLGPTRLHLFSRLYLGLILSSMSPITIIGIGDSKSLLLCHVETMSDIKYENSGIFPWATFSL